MSADEYEKSQCREAAKKLRETLAKADLARAGSAVAATAETAALRAGIRDAIADLENAATIAEREKPRGGGGRRDVGRR